MKKKSVLLFATIAALPHASFALTLQEAIKATMKQPFIESTKDYTQSAKTELKEARARFFPVLDIAAVDVLGKYRTEYEQNNKAQEFDQSYISNRPTLRATVYQNIYNQGLLRRIEANKVNIKHQEDRTKMHQDEYALNTAALYVAILGAQQDIATFQKSIKQLNEIKDALKGHDANQVSLAKVDAELAARQVALSNIQLDLSRLQSEFQQMTGLVDQKLEKVELAENELPQDFEQARQRLEKNNKKLTYKGSEIDLQQALNHELATSSFVPDVLATFSADQSLNSISDYKSTVGSDVSSNRDSKSNNITAQIAAVWRFSAVEKYAVVRDAELRNGQIKEKRAILLDLIAGLQDNMNRLKIFSNKQKSLEKELTNTNIVAAYSIKKLKNGEISDVVLNDAIDYTLKSTSNEKSISDLETSRLTAAFNILSLTGDLTEKFNK
ncbi:MAG: hypothetical protein ACOYOK_15860 [Pseudobdellovibrionaceae bacterium]